MAAPVQTFLLDTHYPIERRILRPRLASPLGGGSFQVRDPWERPIYEFTIKDSHAIKSAAEYIYSFAQYHGGSRPFWWSGNTHGVVSTPILFGFGDGARTHFLLNNRWIQSGEQIYINAVLTGAYSIDASSGLISFVSPPADQAVLTAMYNCVYKVVFWYEQEVLMNERLVYANLFQYEGIVLREMVP